MRKDLFFCKVRAEQFDIAMDIIVQGRSYLKSQGIDQWQNGYPDNNSIQLDIDTEKGYFLTNGKDVFAYLCMDFDGEPAYDDIKGHWLTGPDAVYMVIHRLAFNEQFRGKGLSLTVFDLAEQVCQEKGIHSIRVDTDGDNKIMQHIMNKAGFTYCGTICFAGSDKIAYEKIIHISNTSLSAVIG